MPINKKARQTLLHKFTRSDTKQVIAIIHEHIYSWYAFGGGNYVVSIAGASMPVSDSLEEIEKQWLIAEGEKNGTSKNESKLSICKKHKTRNTEQKK